jgi:L-fucose/D-arabinose isomerase
MRAARELPGPLLLFSNIDPHCSGMVAIRAAVGGPDEVGRTYGRVWGDVADSTVLARSNRIFAPGEAVTSLRGSTFDRIGGRSTGMYTAVANADRWLDQFGVDVEEIDEWEVFRRVDTIAPVRWT